MEIYFWMFRRTLMHIAYISINEVFDMHVLCIVLHWYNDNAILASWIIHNFNLVDLQLYEGQRNYHVQ